MKFRRNKVKREHGIIQDALTWLEELSRCSEVTDIIPGVIEVSRSPERGLVYKYPTQTGCKLLLKSNGSIQEAFVVTKDPEAVRKWVENRFPLISEKVETKTQNYKPKEKKKKNKQDDSTYNDTVKQRGGWQGQSLRSGDSDRPNLGQRLNSTSRQALSALQKELGSSAKHRRK